MQNIVILTTTMWNMLLVNYVYMDHDNISLCDAILNLGHIGQW